MQSSSKRAEQNSSTMSNVLWKFGERITAQFVSTIVAIILARLLYPEDYGVVTIVTIFISLFNALVTGGLGNALIQKKDADELDFSSMFYFSLSFSLIIYAGVFFSAGMLARIYQNAELILITRVMGLRIPIAAVNSIQHSYLARQMQFKKFFAATLGGTVVSAFVGIFLAYAGYGAWALVGQYLTNVFVDTIVLFIVGGWKPKWTYEWQRVKTMLPFGIRMMGAAVLDTGFNELRSIVISLRYSPTDLALYDNGKKYPNLLVVNINASINAVMFPVMSRVQSDSEALKMAMKKAIRISTYALAPILLGLFAVSEEFVEVVLTDKWIACVPFIRITCIMCLFYPIHTVNIQALNALGKSGLVLKLEVIKKALSITVLLISMCFGVTGIALGAMFVSILSTFINAVYSKRMMNYSFVAQMKDVSVSIVISSAMACSIFIINHVVNLDNVLLLLVDIVIGGLVYVGLSLALRVPELKYLIGKVRLMLRLKKADCEGDK